MSDALDEVLIRLDRIEDALIVPKYWGVKEIARLMNVSESYLRSRYWLLPNFGRSDIPGRLLWAKDLVHSWLKTSPTDHEIQWFSLPALRRAALESKIKKSKKKPGQS